MPIQSLRSYLQLLTMPTPSLILVPARFKTGKLYTPLATTSGGVVLGASGDFNVTRATTATRVNANGLIESVASGIPRLDYYTSGGTAGCPALLVEPSGSNVLSYSEEFTNAAWTKNAMTVSTGTTVAFTAPDGTTNADKIIATTASGVAHSLQRTGFASAAYTFSVFAKAGEESVISLWLRSNSVGAVFNLVSGTVSNITVTSARIENYGNGWYRCSVYDSTAGTTASVYGRTGGGYTGNGVDGFYLWGAQLETGSVATSYIPTTTGSITRNADVISVSGAVSGAIGQTEGTIYAEVDIRNSVTAAVLGLDNNSTTDFIIVFRNSSRQITVTIRRANGSLESIITSSALAVGVHKIALGYTNGNYALYINGSLAGTSTNSVSFPTSLTACRIGANAFSSGTGDPFNDRIRAVALYTTRLTNAELATLTTL
jgi:hypothetical protein